MQHESHPSPLALLEDTGRLGRVRTVLRNCSGFVELFCSTEDFHLTEEWLTVRLPTAHLHVQLSALRAVRFADAGECAHPTRPSVWFFGRCGMPLLMLFLDQTTGAERKRQQLIFLALQTRWGVNAVFADGRVYPSAYTIH